MQKMSALFRRISVVACLLASCTAQAPLDGPRSMDFEFLAPGQSKADASGFVSGDRVAVWVTREGTVLESSGNVANGVALSFDGVTWTPEYKLYWPEDGSAVDVYALSPYMEVSDVEEQAFNLPLDQSAGSSTADLLWAGRSGVKYGDGPVILTFRHLLSKVRVELIATGGLDEELSDGIEVRLPGTVTSASLDLVSGTITRNPRGSARPIICRKVGDLSYEALVIPQKIETRVPMIEILAPGVSWLAEGFFTFKAGEEYVMTVKISSSDSAVDVNIKPGTGGW